MMANLHFLRPLWFLAIIPLLGILLLLWQQRPQLSAWEEICDRHLLAHLDIKKGNSQATRSLFLFALSQLLIIFALSGPSWYQFPVATYTRIQPRVLVLDMSDQMLLTDLSPNRLSRAKFKLHDLLARKGVGQLGLVVFTGEAFVVSPLTEDGQTIRSLLSTLTPDIMPVQGQRLDIALREASQLIKTAGFKQGQILVLTADTPSSEAIDEAKQLSSHGIASSILPITAAKSINPSFQRFATSGQGQLLTYTEGSNDLDQWLNHTNTNNPFVLNKDDDIPLWRDEGRWFLIPALLLLLPIFRRGGLQRRGI